MGYTTKFKGAFAITHPPSAEFIEKINLFSSKRHDEKQYPGIWCQWVINADGKLSWNGAEKFYYYIEWLKYLIDEYFEPQGYELNGKVNYRGESFGDIGVIYIKSNDIKQILGRYDTDEDELIMSLTIGTNGEVIHEIL